MVFSNENENNEDNLDDIGIEVGMDLEDFDPTFRESDIIEFVGPTGPGVQVVRNLLHVASEVVDGVLHGDCSDSFTLQSTIRAGLSQQQYADFQAVQRVEMTFFNDSTPDQGESPEEDEVNRSQEHIQVIAHVVAPQEHMTPDPSFPVLDFDPDEAFSELQRNEAMLFHQLLKEESTAAQTSAVSLQMRIGQNSRQTNASSSSMHARQAGTPNAVNVIAQTAAAHRKVLDYNLNIHLNFWTERFYSRAYEYFRIVRPTREPENEGRPPGCRLSFNTPHDEAVAQYPLTIGRDKIREVLSVEVIANDSDGSKDLEVATSLLLDRMRFAFLCPSCDRFFKSEETFEAHLIHRQEPSTKSGMRARLRLWCPYSCGLEFTNHGTMRRHFQSCHGSNQKRKRRSFPTGEFRCEQPGCDRVFDTRVGLTSHEYQAHNRKRTRCKHCKHQFQTGDDLRGHLLTVHGLREGQALPIPCDVEGCEMRCLSEAGLACHKSVVHNIRQRP